MKTRKAVKMRRVIGELTDHELRNFIAHNEGATLYEISKKKNWTLGRVQGSLKRLLRKGLIYSKKKGNKKHYFLTGYPEVPEYIG